MNKQDKAWFFTGVFLLFASLTLVGIAIKIHEDKRQEIINNIKNKVR